MTNSNIDFRYVTMNASREFHSQRRAFVIYENKLYIIHKGSTMSHWEFCQSKFPNISKDSFNQLTRGYFMDNDLVFYKDNFTYDNNVINEALQYIKTLKSRLHIESCKIYFGLIVGEPGTDWTKDYYYGDLLPNNSIVKHQHETN